MKTQSLPIDPHSPAADVVAKAAAVVRAGGLVAFPTETVYGLGANALDPAAVGRIFSAKGRPATNPLIVHVGDIAAAQPLARDFPEAARRLAERFWPGPLTLVLPKSDRVPDAVTARGSTVALRVPAHPVAHALLRGCCLPLAAPSANPSTLLSPTTAEHVRRGLDGKIDMILDAGPTAGGLESTVLDLTATPPRLLRPGLVTPAQIEAIIGPIDQCPMTIASVEPLRSPGMHERHYAPRTPLECVEQSRNRIVELCGLGLRVGWVTWRDESPVQEVMLERLPADPIGYAAGLYAALHRLDQAGVERIIAERPPDGDAWLAVHDRLRRATI